MFLAYLPALILVFSGLAVGYILWYRESHQDDVLRQKLLTQNAEMKQALSVAKNSYATLDERFTRQRGQLGVLQQLCDDWSASREQAEGERVELDVKLTERTKRHDELVTELEAAREHARRLEDAVHNLSQKQLDKISDIESTWQQKQVKVESSLVRNQFELEKVATERAAQEKKLERAEARIAELESELKSQAAMLEDGQKSASGLEQDHGKLATALAESKKNLAQAEEQCAAERAEKQDLTQQLDGVKEQLANWQKQVEELKSQEAGLLSDRQKAESLVSSLNNANGQLEKVLGQRDSALERCATLQTTIKGLQTRIDNQESSIHRLRQCQEDALENLKHELQIRSEIEAKHDERQSELRAQLDNQKVGFEKQLAQLQETSTKQKQEFVAEVELLHEVAEQEIVDLKKNLESANTTISTLKVDQDKGGQVLKEFETLQLQFTQRETQLSELAVALRSSSAEYEQQINKLEIHREQLVSDLEAAQKQLQSQLKQDSETIGLLQSERDELRDEVERLNAKVAQMQEAMVHEARYLQQVTVDAEQVADVKAQAARLEKDLERKENTLKHLQAESNELARLRDDHAASIRRQAELQARLDSMLAEHLTQKSLRETVAQHEQTIEELRCEMAEKSDAPGVVQDDKSATLISFTQAIKQRNESSYDPAYGGRVRRDSVRGVVFTEAPESRDDLKRISGVATVLENRLNEFGIYTFKQIMDWQPEEVEEFSRLLAFRDRILRDDWQGQARSFYEEKTEAGKAA